MGNVFSCSGDAIVSCCWNECIRERSMYICKLEENLKALDDRLTELEAQRRDVEEKVYKEEQRRLKPLHEVELWLSRVTVVQTEVAKLNKNRSQEIQRLCLGGCCSKNYKSTYKFGKRVALTLKHVINLKNEKFHEVATEVPTDPVAVIPTERTVGLESKVEELWSCLQDEQVVMVGLYGTGGVGKTTLLKQINKKFNDYNKKCHDTPNNFNVIWVVVSGDLKLEEGQEEIGKVSRDLKLEKVQEDIGENIGFSDDNWKCKSLDKKSADICRVLSQKKFVLLLDDLWEWIDLFKVGIPLPDIQNGSKIAFTTRSEEVCFQMKAKKIRVECLAWENAWKLFQEKVGQETLDAHPNIPNLAKTVAKECGGLPLALKAIGLAMAGKKERERWDHAITVLKRNASEFSGMKNEVLPLLKFSYDNLRHDKVKSCFRYCALFLEDFSIKKADLIDYWIGEGFLDGYDDRREAKNEGCELISTLVQTSLLEDEGDYVKMHDVIRDLALWIASECGKVKYNYLVNAGGQLIEAPDVEKWERARRVSLMRNHIGNLSKTPKCPNLLTLFLHENRLKMIASEFFQFMPSLRVLDLSKNYSLKELPVGISNLVSLEYLNLSNTCIQQLPDELKTLIKLKYLNLDWISKLKRIPRHFITSFLKLEVLRMYKCGDSREAVEESILSKGNDELLIMELMCLKHLNTLTINIKSESALQSFLSFQKLQSCTQSLFLNHLNSIKQLNVSSLANMKRLERFSIRNCYSLQDLKTEWASEGREIQVSNDLHNSLVLSEKCFDSLCSVSIHNIPKLGDLTWLILAPNLTSLHVTRCHTMEEIISVGKLCKVPEAVGNLNPFAKLEELRLRNLRKLKSIYRSALPFPHLKQIHVSECPKLKTLPLNSNSVEERKIVIKGQEHWWIELEWEDEATQKAFLPCFNDITRVRTSSIRKKRHKRRVPTSS